jgi:hypothetical protein
MLTHGSDMLGKARPIREIVPAGERQASVVAIEWDSADIRLGQRYRQPRNPPIEESRVSVPHQFDRIGVMCAPSGEQRAGLSLIGCNAGIKGKGGEGLHR